MNWPPEKTTSSSKNIREMRQIIDKIVRNTRYEESRALAEKFTINFLAISNNSLVREMT